MLSLMAALLSVQGLLRSSPQSGRPSGETESLVAHGMMNVSMALMPIVAYYDGVREAVGLLNAGAISVILVLLIRVVSGHRRADRSTLFFISGYHLLAAVAMLYGLVSMSSAKEGTTICATVPYSLATANWILALIFIFDGAGVLTVCAFSKITLPKATGSTGALAGAKATSLALLLAFFPHLTMDANMAYMLLRM